MLSNKMQKSDFQSAGEALEFTPEVSVLTRGCSMHPMLRQHKDVVTVERVERPFKKGDVVLYPGKNNEFVLHRIMRINGDILIIRGDNNYFTERLNKNQIVGILKEFYRDGKYINCNDNFKYKLYSFYICHSYWLRFLWRKVIRRTLGKIKRLIIK